jgi:hypothetical protein
MAVFQASSWTPFVAVAVSLPVPKYVLPKPLNAEKAVGLPSKKINVSVVAGVKKPVVLGQLTSVKILINR